MRSRHPISATRFGSAGRNFKAVPSHAVMLCLIYPVIGIVLARTVLGYSTCRCCFR